MPSTQPSLRSRLESLVRILRLERSRGCSNNAVVGGLDRFLQRLVQDGTGDPLLKSLQRHGLLDVTYADMALPQRERWVQEVERLLGRLPKPAGRRQGGPDSTKTTASPPNRSQKPRPSVSVGLDSPITALRSVTTRLAPRLRRLGVQTVRDLLYFFPNRHNDFGQVRRVSELQVGQEQTVVGVVWEAREASRGRGGTKATEAVLGDETGNIRIVWFNQPYLARTFRPNTHLVVSGRVSLFGGRPVFESPEYEVVEGADVTDLVHTGRLVPVYPTPGGVSPRTVRRAVREGLDLGIPLVQEFLPPDLVRRRGLLGLPQALQQAHYPDGAPTKEAARRRLAFDELFLMQLAVMGRRRAAQTGTSAVPVSVDRRVLQAFFDSLPFSLTAAQERALQEVLADLQRGDRPMGRLLQGDVGSGKTVVALAALLTAATSGCQGALMVPTEVLAEQHFFNVSSLLAGLAQPAHNRSGVSAYLDPFPRPVSVGLLTGSLPRRERDEVRRRIAGGSIDIVIGTQALIQGEVEFPRLALAVVDEQHRFGVMQRASLREKGESPHILVMSATPIPRTLALTLYGDLDISTIDQLPPGRQPIMTRQVPPEKRDVAYAFLRKQMQEGRQAFIICPLIEESEVVQARAATEEHRRLAQEVYPDMRLGLLHGRMGIREKQQVMEAFRRGDLDILVSTPVVEVGIDVPNAAVMLIEGADRFGLSQLHQFRGRVGRGAHKSYCLLLAESPSQEARERLHALEQNHDGFALAEVDLQFRGPGDFFGTRQSGLPSLRMARLADRDLLVSAREEADRLLKEDPHLHKHPALSQEMHRSLGEAVEEYS